MEILVNDKSIDFKLEKMMTLNELLENIQEWASKEKMFILDYLVDGKPILPGENQMNSENIGKLEVIIGNKYSLLWENLLETEAYIYKTLNYLVPRLQDSVTSQELNIDLVKDGLLWVINSYDSLNKHFKSNDKNNFNHEFIENILINENYVLLVNFLSAVMENIKQWKKKLFYTLLDSMNISEIREIYLRELSQVLDSLDIIASNFTIGKDLDALSELENIVDWISIGLMVFEKSGTSPENIEMVKKVLNELNDALQKQDFVTLADIVDFDLKDALQHILSQKTN